MLSVRTGPAIGLFAEVALLAGLADVVGLGPAGWLVGGLYGVLSTLALTRGLARSGGHPLGPADRVTVARAVLVGGITALTADSFARPTPVAMFVALASVALALDAVDGWVARRTRTASTFGARFDMEVDAFLILVLSVYVARFAGGWVLAIGVARYAFFAAGWLLPWLRGTVVPPRYWCKVVAAIQGVALTFAAAAVVPRFLTTIALALALALLAESFGREIWWLWRHRALTREAAAVARPADERNLVRHRGRVRSVAGRASTVLAVLLVWFALVGPDRMSRLTVGAFARIPVEGIVVVALALVLPATAGRVLAALAGLVLGVLTILKIFDMGFFAVLDRPFNPVLDRGTFGPAAGVLSDSIGKTGTTVVIVAVLVVLVALLVLMPIAVVRLTRVASRHQAKAVPILVGLGVLWGLCALFGVQVVPGAPVASTSAAVLAYDQARDVEAAIQDQQTFQSEIAQDPLGGAPGRSLLTSLRGKDVIVAFVESYGRVAVQGSTFSPQVDAMLEAGTHRLGAAGFAAKSAFLTSPTFGGISWLAHSTLQSGLWVDNQQRYDELVASDRFTLSDAFKQAGWRTVGDVPSNQQDWPEGTSFYHYDKLYDSRNVGYAGPPFGYANMPDQYILSAFQRMELGRTNRAPLMAEIDLVSSHTPWAPLPRMIGWNSVGDGSVYDAIKAQGQKTGDVWSDPNLVRAAYGQSIEYSLNALVSFVQHYGDKNLVLVVLGDHQPATIVTGEGASHDVPITIIAHDPAVMDRISSWGWDNGMLPGPKAPVWPMSSFRDRFIRAYSPSLPSTANPSTSHTRQ